MESVYSLHNIWRYIFTHTVIFFLFILSFISLSLPFNIEARPYFILMPLYYWAIYRPSLIMPLFTFFIGIFYDLILGFPVGLHAVLFVSYFWVITRQRLFFLGQGYHMVWAGFSISCFGVLCIEYLFFSIFSLSFLNLMTVMYSTVMSVLIYPIMSYLFIFSGKILPVASQTSFSVE